MYDIDALERQWRKYRRKRILKYSAIFLSTFGVLLVSWTFIHHVQETRSTETSPLERRSASTFQKSVQPSRNPSKSVGSDTEVNVSQHLSTALPKSKDRRSNMLIQVTDKKGQTGVKGSAPSSSKSMLLKVSDAKSTQVVKQIEARFPDTRDYDDAIYLAKYYYDKHRYRKAENWAMQANTIDSTQEESWIIYAKAKAKQGRRAAALRILQAYYDQTGSLRAKMLIDRIRKGRNF